VKKGYGNANNFTAIAFMKETSLTTTCCIAGGGPAGMMMGFLASRV